MPQGAWTSRAAGRGELSDSNGLGDVTMTLTQVGASVGGTIEMFNTAFSAAGVGEIAGAINRGVLSFTVHMPQGGYPAPFAFCEAESSGSGSASSTEIFLSYSGGAGGAIGCARTWTAGQMTFSR